MLSAKVDAALAAKLISMVGLNFLWSLWRRLRSFGFTLSRAGSLLHLNPTKRNKHNSELACKRKYLGFHQQVRF